MKHALLLTLAALLLLLPLSALAQDAPKANLESQDAKISYYFGMNLGRSLKELPLEFDRAAFLQAVDDMVSGRGPALSDEDLQSTLGAFEQRVQEEQLKKKQELDVAREEQKPENMKQITAFKADSGLKSTDSGLKYRVVTPGAGDMPLPTDRVEVNYKGMLEDGTVFDSSYDRGSPAQFPVGNVIKGWIEVLQLMSPGAKYEVLIPSDLAYGPNPPGNSPIPPNASLFFEIELLKVL